MPRAAGETKAHVLRVAGELFYRRGIRATGIDLVAAEADVAPPTLYRIFTSKDGLVSAYVQDTHREFQDRVASVVEAAGPDPRDQILAIFDTVSGQVASERYRGCPMQIALAEFPDADLPARRHAVAAKSWLRETLAELTGKLEVGDPAEVADHLMLIFEGLHASGLSLGPDGPAKRVRGLVEMIISSASPRPDSAR
ncbi:TetR/AcrR family transcriptional regulator [Actinomadura sp. ATCC 31491]|uniref:TetR/AcrR family transcriptional regulator n=1 Tax=Actinomadura luzonensis TaxID=2805427 RepID=A0ABT0FYT8_9ACTN|nr:TetR/AcrR family transcriptional regulator [Actinomadura luzonensis]MCK2217110.1 TetR/AcrR family transcriptional regulator [Actinomadura luzonensis]